jgi:hypothetical protein
MRARRGETLSDLQLERLAEEDPGVTREEGALTSMVYPTQEAWQSWNDCIP